jgi:hypothetical protein
VKKTVLLLLFMAGFVSCHKNPESTSLIPRDKFREILTEIYLADGYYMMNYGDIAKHKDTTNFYNDIIRNYGFTRANFDSTLKYYTNKSKKFEAIYDDVITDLNKRQQEIYQLQQYSDTSRNLFKKKTTWNLPKDGPREMIPFKIAIKDTGLYTIVLQLKVFDDDQTKNLHLTAYYWYDNGTKNGHIEYFPFIIYKKSKRLVVVSTSKRNRNKKNTHIKGWILNHDNENIDFTKHVEVRAIIVARN